MPPAEHSVPLMRLGRDARIWRNPRFMRHESGCESSVASFMRCRHSRSGCNLAYGRRELTRLGERKPAVVSLRHPGITRFGLDPCLVTVENDVEGLGERTVEAVRGSRGRARTWCEVGWKNKVGDEHTSDVVTS